MRTLLEEKISTISRVSLSLWGNELMINGYQDPGGQNTSTVIYKNCKKIEWEVLESDINELSSPVVVLVGWQLGDEDYGHPAIISTGFFEIVVWYKTFEVRGFAKAPKKSKSSA
jgi:hypothetical protein